MAPKSEFVIFIASLMALLLKNPPQFRKKVKKPQGENESVWADYRIWFDSARLWQTSSDISDKLRIVLGSNIILTQFFRCCCTILLVFNLERRAEFGCGLINFAKPGPCFLGKTSQIGFCVQVLTEILQVVAGGLLWHTFLFIFVLKGGVGTFFSMSSWRNSGGNVVALSKENRNSDHQICQNKSATSRSCGTHAWQSFHNHKNGRTWLLPQHLCNLEIYRPYQTWLLIHTHMGHWQAPAGLGTGLFASSTISHHKTSWKLIQVGKLHSTINIYLAFWGEYHCIEIVDHLRKYSIDWEI